MDRIWSAQERMVATIAITRPHRDPEPSPRTASIKSSRSAARGPDPRPPATGSPTLPPSASMSDTFSLDGEEILKPGVTSVGLATGCISCARKSALEFREFALFGSFIELAVAFVMGAVFESLLTSFVQAFVTPILAIFGGDSFENLGFSIRGSPFKYGLFIDSLLTFLITAAIVFFGVVQPSRAFIRKLSPAQLKRICPHCLSAIPAKAMRCCYCTQLVEMAKDDELVHGQSFKPEVELGG